MKEQYEWNDCPILQDVYPENKFDHTFGIWPDSAVNNSKNIKIFDLGCIF